MPKKPQPFTDEEKRILDGLSAYGSTQSATNSIAADVEYIKQCIDADRKRIEELEKERDRTEGLVHVNEKLNLKIIKQTAEIERLRGAINGLLEEPTIKVGIQQCINRAFDTTGKNEEYQRECQSVEDAYNKARQALAKEE